MKKGFLIFLLFLFCLFLSFYFYKTYDVFLIRISQYPKEEMKRLNPFQAFLMLNKRYYCLRSLNPVEGYLILDEITGSYQFAPDSLAQDFLKEELKFVKKYSGEKIEIKDDVSNKKIWLKLNKERVILNLYFRISDACFRSFNVREGMKYLKKALKLGARKENLNFLGECYSYHVIKKIIEELLKDSHNVYQLNEAFFSVRRFVYIEKNMDLVRNYFVENYPKEGEEIFEKFKKLREENDKKMIEIINQETKKDYWEIDIRKYFNDYIREILSKNEDEKRVNEIMGKLNLSKSTNEG